MASGLGSPISVRVSDEVKERIAAIARVTRRSQGDVVRELLERDLDALEWELRIAERAAAHRSGQTETISARRVDEELGFDDEPAADALDSVS